MRYVKTIGVMVGVAGVLALAGCRRSEDDRYIRAGADEKSDAMALKQGGPIDSWMIGGTDGILRRWIRDKNHDGRADSWSFFKNGRAFIDEDDLDFDGKVDAIYLHIVSEDNTRIREFSFGLDDRSRNVFTEHEDTGWQALRGLEEKSR